MNQQIEAALNDQISKEASSSQYYLAMASWAETKGFLELLFLCMPIPMRNAFIC
jgi:ferritin